MNRVNKTNWKYIYFLIFLRVQPYERPLRLNIMVFCPEHPKRRDQNLKYTPTRDDEYPRRFHMGVPPIFFRLGKCKVRPSESTVELNSLGRPNMY